MNTADAIAKLRGRLGDAVGATSEFRGEHTVPVDRARIAEACRFLKQECGFDMLTDLSGVDNFGEDPRFQVEYLLYAIAHRCRLRLRVRVPEDDLIVDSVAGIWRTADWHEREAYDMFGIRFRGHPNLKRILMWDGYPHYPLRKDFPLAGVPAELPETAVDAGKVESAPMLGGPFASASGTTSSIRREPRQADTAAERTENLQRPTKQEQV
jgi:NADH-quinone oxidoreductase subunit C